MRRTEQVGFIGAALFFAGIVLAIGVSGDMGGMLPEWVFWTVPATMFSGVAIIAAALLSRGIGLSHAAVAQRL